MVLPVVWRVLEEDIPRVEETEPCMTRSPSASNKKRGELPTAIPKRVSSVDTCAVAGLR